MESYGRRGGSGRRYSKEYGYRGRGGRGGRRGRGSHRRDYEADQDYQGYHYGGHRDQNERDYRGRPGNDWRDRSDEDKRGNHEDSRSGHRRDGDDGFRRRGGGRPPGLKGKEIGLYYAQKGRAKQVQQERESRQFIQMDGHKERHLSKLLATIRAADTIPSQPSRSYRDAFNEEEEEEDEMEETFKMGSESEAFGAVPKSSRHYVPDSWCDEDQTESVSQPPSEKRTHVEAAASFSKPGGSEEFSDGASPHATTSTGSSHGESVQFQRPSSMGGYPGNDGFAEDEDDDLDDIDYNDEEFISIGQDEILGESDEDSDEDYDVVPKVSEMYKLEEADSEFVAEFLSHNEANRRSGERLNEIGQADWSLRRDGALDQKLRDELQDRMENNPQYKKMHTFRKKLPSYSMREEILNTISKNQIVVLSGETGCGKTTQVPQFILDDHIQRADGSLCRIVCTQPRRISAISVAERVADERAEACGGGSVGYQIRLEHKLPRLQGSMLYCTTGIMLKWLASDPLLSRSTHVILDEIHERDLQSDFLMIILKDVLKKRTDLKLILMSATLNAEMFSQYFGNCPMLNIPGFTYPVTEYLLEDVVEMIQYKHNAPLDQGPPRQRRMHGRKKREAQEERWNFEVWTRNLHDRYSQKTRDVLMAMNFDLIDLDVITQLIEHICRNKGDGAILVFLPGWEQISKLHNMLQKVGFGRSGKFLLIPLHSQMPTVNQRQVFERPPPGVRKIVIATNIAETSITIDDVVYVIDCGKIKIKNFDPENSIGTLMAEWVSQANARQRRGRSGRVQPGECYHLYTGYQESLLMDYQLPEILRTRLEELCLQIKLLKLGLVRPFVAKAMQPPSMEALQNAVDTLINLNAFDENEDLTPLGYHLAKMPVDPHTGKMLLFGAMFSCLNPILTIAASLSFKDAFYIPLGKEKEADRRRRVLSDGSKSDHIMLVKAYEGWERAKACNNANHYCWENFLSQSTLRMLCNMRRQFTTLLCDMGFLKTGDPKAGPANRYSGDLKVVKAVITAGLFPNVAKIKRAKGMKRPSTLKTKTDRSVLIHPKSVNCDEMEFASPWFIYHLKMKTTRIFLYDCTMVSAYPLLFFGGNIAIRRDSDQDCITVDDWIVFRASQSIGHLVKELRVELDKLLAYKITHPSATNWNPKDKEGALMNAILDLFRSEYH